MSSETEIANLAGVLIGTESRITSLDDDRVLARTLKGVWAAERRATLRDGVFNFSVQRFSLAPEVPGAGVVLHPWAYSLPLPAEALKLVEVLSLAHRDQYQLEGRSIRCDSAGPLYVRCVVDVAEPALWDESFANAFAHRLAWKVGPRIAGSAFSQDNAWRAYRLALSDAKRVDALENPPIAADDGEWIEARFGAGRSYDPGQLG